MRHITMLSAMAACLAMAVSAFAAGAGSPCAGTPSDCGGCGCHAPCKKVKCQVICDYEEVEIKCWDVKCEEYCLPIPIIFGCGDKCGSCGGCGTGCGTSCSKKGCGGKCEPSVTCGHPRMKKKLMLRTIKVKKPVYKCETRYLCGGCEADARAVAPQESAPAPEAAPVPKAAMVPKTAPLPPKQAAIPTLPRF